MMEEYSLLEEQEKLAHNNGEGIYNNISDNIHLLRSSKAAHEDD